MKLIVLGVALCLIGFGVWWVLEPDVSSYIEHELPILTGKKAVELQPIELTEHTIAFPDGTDATFQLAAPFKLAIAADGLGKARFIAKSPDGRLFIPDLVDMNLSHEGRIWILDDWNPNTHTFESKQTYLSGLRGPNSVAFYTDKEGNEWIYITLTDRLVRYPYTEGDTEPSGEAEVIATFPDYQSPTASGVVWHITRTILFHNDTLYVAVGSGCNVCEQPENETRAVILAMDPTGENARVYADGIKNAVGLAVVDGTLYATENGVDHLGIEDPDDLMYRIEEGAHYGWPYCYEADGTKHEDTSVAWVRTPVSCTEAPLSFTAFDPHSAPLGLAYFTEAHETLENSFLVALHGSFQPSIGNGYQLMRVSQEGEQAVFMEGFLNEQDERVARAVDILPYDKHSFFFTDDHAGRLYYVYTTGD